GLGVRQPNPLNPAHAWALRKPLGRYAKWWLGEHVARPASPALSGLPENLAGHARFAAEGLQHSRLEISAAMRTHQLKLAARRCGLRGVPTRVQALVVMRPASLYAAGQADEVVRAAADVLCRDLTRKLTGRRPSDRDFRAFTKLGETIESGGFRAIAGVEP